MSYKKCLLFLLAVIIFSSCGFFGEKNELIKDIDFTENADWLLVHNDNYDMVEVIHDPYILEKLKGHLVIKRTEDCGGTTPDYCFQLYKNGQQLRTQCYCAWEPLSVSMGSLRYQFKKAKEHKIEAFSIPQHDYILDSLSSLNNVYLLYPKDTVVKFPDQLEFDIKLVDNGQNIFDQEIPIEQEFQKLFRNGSYNVKADWYLAEVGNPRKLGYHVIVDCDSSFLKHFDKSLLVHSDLFTEATDYRYENKKFVIYYYTW